MDQVAIDNAFISNASSEIKQLIPCKFCLKYQHVTKIERVFNDDGSVFIFDNSDNHRECRGGVTNTHKHVKFISELQNITKKLLDLFNI